MNRLDTVESVEESFGSGDAARILEEDFTTDLKAIFGDEHAKGSKARQLLAKRFEKEWKEFLGRTDRKGTPEDMERFLLKRVGFEPSDLEVVLGKTMDPADQSTAKVTTAGGDDRSEPDEKPEVQSEPDTSSEKNDDDAKFRKSDGTVDMRAVRQALSKMPTGEKLHVNGKTYFVGGDDDNTHVGTRTVPAESIEERDMLGERQLIEFDVRQPIGPNAVKKILNRAAAHAYDEYLMNRPSDAGAHGGYEGGEDGGTNALGGSGNGGGSRQAGARSTAAAKAGNIDLDRMWKAIESEGLDSDDLATLKHVVSSTRGLKSIKDPNDVKMLAAVGYAFLKARK